VLSHHHASELATVTTRDAMTGLTVSM
jgi:hypothetical protein